MAAPNVFEDATEEFGLEGVGQLFAGKSFWVAQRVPSRNRLLDDIRANGGEVVALEKKADYKIADHFRKDCPPGSISYQFIEKSIREGQLRDPKDHPAGPPIGEAREPGALHRPTKSGRAAYTAEEDKILYKWVRECEANGGQASGNEIYKQLEAKYPRHTWSSWRDRYLKQLRGRPPSAFNIPDNAPPSPSSDIPAEQAPAAKTIGVTGKQTASKEGKTPAPTKVSGQGSIRDRKANVPPIYTLAQLETAFSSEDWEDLYAYVDAIDATKGKTTYQEAWKQWADSKDNQTVDQWQQYYEKVVRPQWLRDPEWKRKQVMEKVEKRHGLESSQKSQETQEEEDVPAPIPTATESKDPSLPVPGAATVTVSSEPKMMSSSTAQYESPKYISDLYQNTLKRVRGDEQQYEAERDASQQQPHPAKRQRSLSPSINNELPKNVSLGTGTNPVEVLSDKSSDSEGEDEQVDDQIRQDIADTQNRAKSRFDQELGEAEKEMESVESLEWLDIDHLPPPSVEIGDASEDDLPENSPTPRAPRQRVSNFDTQAILSSPSQGIGFTRLPRPADYTKRQHLDTERRSPSIAPHLDSDASTTQSLQEFRRSLNDEDTAQPSYPPLKPLPRATFSSPAPSDSSTGSGDPDEPLDGDEVDDFFAAQNALGFSDDFVAKALKRTRFRPALAELVIDAWVEGRPLPNQRGIWSVEDDAAAESGDGVALAILERKHTLDGWGGLTERTRFLEAYRNR
ncbi:hypothetical protein BDU57DRAFT_78918 [Ampelomyces quisqualis]|uniref:DNA-binding protein RAP1 n=1 Tax=Ampelomyces quisqualis TaxID=50730 RepID=A0A6A5Q9S1_AMPQU|nr:hypothetical protein BDU57DRAFT_78918 [Ampelomyces quisqualis]